MALRPRQRSTITEPGPPDSNPPLTPGRRRLFTVITFALPVLLVVFLEAGLRIFHYGPDLSLLIPQTINGRTYWTMNPDVKARYFSRIPFAPSTSPDFFLLPKPAGTYRVFCLGGSTTVGYPYWFNGSFSAYLRDRLRTVFPGRQIEVINMGMTATNSYTTLDFARELVRCQPDLIIVYDGHNEFYGALGAASNESLGGIRWFNELYLNLVHFRTFLLLRNAYDGVARFLSGSAATDQRTTVMERLSRGRTVRYGSPIYRSTLAAFRANLHALKGLCLDHGIPLLLASQVSNLRDRPPFVSGDEPGATQEDRDLFRREFQRGLGLVAASRPDSALPLFRQLLTDDTLRAEVHYQIARCLDALGDRSGAEHEYIRARDDDELRFRTSSDFNDAIRSVCDTPSVGFVDMEAWFRRNSPDFLIGNELILEHLHPNSRGYFLMAKAYAASMRDHGLLAQPSDWNARDTVPDNTLWEERPITDVDEMMARRTRDVLTSAWPFTNHPPTVPAIPPTDTLGQIAEGMVRGRTTWLDAHNAAAVYYLGRQEPGKAEREYDVITREAPLDVAAYLQRARILDRMGKADVMRSVLKTSIEVEPTLYAFRTLGDIALKAGRPLEAITMYQGALPLTKSAAERTDNLYVLALAYLRANMPDLCVARLQEILAIRPDFAEARTLLQTIRRLSPGMGQPPAR